jgi:carboxyl-terminal processing protease
MFFRSIQARLTVRFLLAFLLVAAFMFSGGVSYALASSPDTDYQPFSFEDFSALSWTLAFSSLHAKFSREYAFTEWKSIDWNAL